MPALRIDATLRHQGLLFSFLAGLVSLASHVLGRLDPRAELLVLGLLILVLGVPHGALDLVLARRLYQLRSAKQRVAFVLAYLFLAALVVALWIHSPGLFLAVFLLISAVHFSGDPAEGTPLLARVLYGGAIMVLPTAQHASEVEGLLSLLVGNEPAMLLVGGLRPLAFAWLFGLVVAAALRLRSDPTTGLELLAVALLATAAPPLLAFTVFFCLMHGVRHVLRTVAHGGAARGVLLEGFGPMVAVLALASSAWMLSDGVPLDARILRPLFVGLAALTVPHMLVVERIRLAGWAPPRFSKNERTVRATTTSALGNGRRGRLRAVKEPFPENSISEENREPD